jgi:FAD:protein FMN transferase
MRTRRLLGAALVCLTVAGCSSPATDPIRREQYLLGTVCSLSVYQSVKDEVLVDAFAALTAIEARLSVVVEDSEVSRVNRAAGVAPVAVSAETRGLVAVGLDFAARSGGALDVSVGPLVRLWGIGTDHARVPAQEEIDRARALIGYRDVVVDDAAGTVYLRRAGMSLDLGAIGKGYAADRVAELLRSRGVKHALIDLGGNIYVVGKHPTRSTWRVGVQNPDAARGVYLGVLAVNDTSVVTSGMYERYFVQDGVRYHHILDPATGRPVSNGVVSTTIVCASSTTADALSTSLFVMGAERGLALARSVPGVEAMVITEDRKIHATPGLRSMLTITDEAYSLAQE